MQENRRTHVKSDIQSQTGHQIRICSENDTTFIVKQIL